MRLLSTAKDLMEISGGASRRPLWRIARPRPWARKVGSANSLNLNQFEINIAPDSRAAVELVLGQQLGPNVYVRVQQGVGDLTQTNVILEYEFAKWLRLQTNFLQGADPQQQLFQRVQSTGIDLVFSFTFK